MSTCARFAPLFLWVAFLALWLSPALAAPASQGTETNFIYTVQPGDTLTLIAVRYNLSLADIILANHLSNPNLIFPGQSLSLPGVPAVAPASPLNETAEPTLGANQTHMVQPGETLFAIANLYGVSIGAIVQANNLTDPNLIQVGQVLQIPTGPPPTPAPLTPPFAAIELSEPVIIQGRTLVMKVTLAQTATLSATFEGRTLAFNQNSGGQWWTIIAIHALTEPNVYPIVVTATLPDSSQVTIYQNVTVIEGPYATENIQLDADRSQLLDAELIRAEQQKLANMWLQVSPTARWQGAFRYPVEASSLRITSRYGTRRSYNGGPATSFHDGVDFGGSMGTPIYAPAAGVVVLAEPLTVRGRAVLIDHGMGLFSGFYHQSQIIVAVGQQVQAGDLIGYIGDSGLVTGPHLHWDMRLQGISIEPLQWVEQTIP